MKAENWQNIWDFIQWKMKSFFKQILFLNCSWRFLRSNDLEQLEFKLKKILGFRNMQEKLENNVFSSWLMMFTLHSLTVHAALHWPLQPRNSNRKTNYTVNNPNKVFKWRMPLWPSKRTLTTHMMCWKLPPVWFGTFLCIFPFCQNPLWELRSKSFYGRKITFF